MTTKDALAALALAASLAGPAFARSTPSDQPPPSPGAVPAQGDQARPSGDTTSREQSIKEKHREPRRIRGTAPLASPNRTLPGQPPDRIGTPGAFGRDRGGDDTARPAVPSPTTPPESRHGD